MAEDWGRTSPFYAGVALSVLAIMAFLWVRERSVEGQSAVSVRQLLAAGRDGLLLRVSVLAALTQYATFASPHTFMPVYATDVGASEAQLGLLAAAFLGTYTVANLGAGTIVRRWGERTTVAIGMLVFAVGTGLVPLLQDVTQLGVLQAVAGIGRGLSFPVLMGLSIKDRPGVLRGSAMGFFQAIYALGMVLGPAISGFLGDLLGLRSMFVSTGLVCLLGAILAVWALPGSRKGDQRLRGSAYDHCTR
jgi:MFS family permease